MSVVERIWFGPSPASALTRAALWPLAQAYGGIVALRRHLYEGGALRSETPVIPAISIGNLTVGGTGKTPVAAWFAAQLAKSATPAIVLRGYGGDEPEVHRRLNPTVRVIANPDRAAALRDAAAAGADVAVLDDAFQHFQVGRAADVVLVSAEQMMRPIRLLPAGPWREPLDAVRRADLVVVTRKTADFPSAERTRRRVLDAAPATPTAVVHLAPAELVSVGGDERTRLERLRGARVTAIAGIGEPTLFGDQLTALGATVTMAAFADHHAFTDAEVVGLARQARGDLVVCTLKDAVKLAGRWPGPARLWYVSQQLVVDQGAAEMSGLIRRVLDARAASALTAG